jgi:hypothetical protein
MTLLDVLIWAFVFFGGFVCGAIVVFWIVRKAANSVTLPW